ncbi:hypothetical protein BC629DRAFT_10587 [Irpex lacteus]|nr:hypothetical protein BC629DRAFT_10587 [Irpex lacteus]
MNKEIIMESRRFISSKIPLFVNRTNEVQHASEEGVVPAKQVTNLPPAQMLAFELLHEMFLRLSITDLITCTMVCQAWCACSSYILFRTCDVQRTFWNDPRHVTSIRPPAAKKYPEPDPADFKRFACAVIKSPTSHRFTATVHTLRLHGLLDFALFQDTVHGLKCLCDLHLDEVVFSPISTRRRRLSLLAIQRSSSTTPVSEEKRILKRLTVHEPNLNQLAPPFRYALWSISLLCFSRIHELNLSCSLRVPRGYRRSNFGLDPSLFVPRGQYDERDSLRILQETLALFCTSLAQVRLSFLVTLTESLTGNADLAVAWSNHVATIVRGVPAAEAVSFDVFYQAIPLPDPLGSWGNALLTGFIDRMDWSVLDESAMKTVAHRRKIAINFTHQVRLEEFPNNSDTGRSRRILGDSSAPPAHLGEPSEHYEALVRSKLSSPTRDVTAVTFI